MNLSLNELKSIFARAGAIRMLAKPLVQNDNSKQQLYLGGNFSVLNAIPFGDVTAYETNFKAPLELYWLTENAEFEPARHAQLILYPDYPEVRMSGFLKGCSAAPSEHMRPVPRGSRGARNGWDGRVLFFGVTKGKKIFTYLGLPDSLASLDFECLREQNSLRQDGVLFSIPITMPSADTSIDSKQALLAKLTTIKENGWIDSVRMHRDGTIRPYEASNGGGYTLEAQFNIIPNGRSEPDFMDWEIKGYSKDRVTLMTPEPNGGYYKEHGVKAFLQKYGHRRTDDSIYFTGTHKVGAEHIKTKQTLQLIGFDAVNNKITDSNAGITLLDSTGNASAIWTYAGLIEHWGRKHANAAYVQYESQIKVGGKQYRYLSPTKMGQGTDFIKFLSAMYAGHIIYDPAPKLTYASSSNATVKARNQFRVSAKQLSRLYNEFDDFDF